MLMRFVNSAFFLSLVLPSCCPFFCFCLVPDPRRAMSAFDYISDELAAREACSMTWYCLRFALPRRHHVLLHLLER